MTTSNHTDDDQEMSMDEILASIRRYVSSDEPAPKFDAKPSEQSIVKPQVDTDNVPPQRVEPRFDMQSHDDVVRLNEDARHETSRPEMQRQEAPRSTTWLDEPYMKQAAAEPAKDAYADAEPRFNRPTVAQKQPSPVTPKTILDGLVSDKTLVTTMESFTRLRDASVKAPLRHESAPTQGLNQTLDQLFESLARPMIRDWLDRNLPPMVERMVAKEIERITKS